MSNVIGERPVFPYRIGDTVIDYPRRHAYLVRWLPVAFMASATWVEVMDAGGRRAMYNHRDLRRVVVSLAGLVLA